jgi:hypothetical protein
MKLERAILSSNDNPKYLDFWPYVAKAWRELIGIEPVLFFIGEAGKVEKLSQHGQVIQVPVHPDWDIVNQAQSIRLWAGTKFPEENLIISDLDMLPISREYFIDSVKKYPDNSLISYTSDVMNYGFYLRSPQLPMCYLAGKGSTFNEILSIDTKTTWEDFMMQMKSANMGYGTDQKYFWKKFLPYRGSDRYIGLNRGWIGGKIATKRLDKVNWPIEYNPFDYYDAHMPLPLSDNREICVLLFKKLHIL